MAANEMIRMFAEWAARPHDQDTNDAVGTREAHEAEFDRYRAARERVLGNSMPRCAALAQPWANSELDRG